MTSEQASVAPIVNSDDALDTVTLKNLVALDIVQHNESVLSAFQLLDDSVTRIKLPRYSTPLSELIAKKKDELAQLQEETKTTAAAPTTSPDATLLTQLSAEFLQDSVPQDDTDHHLKQFEKENGVNVHIRDYDSTYKFGHSAKLQAHAAAQGQAPQTTATPDGDGDIEITQ